MTADQAAAFAQNGTKSRCLVDVCETGGGDLSLAMHLIEVGWFWTYSVPALRWVGRLGRRIKRKADEVD